MAQSHGAVPERAARAGQGTKEMPVPTHTFRDVMAGVCSPVAIVTTANQGRPHGSTVSAFASLSLEPPMVSVALGLQSRLLAHVLEVGKFGINLLAWSQADMARLFASATADRFEAAPWFSHDGIPRFHQIAGWLGCTLDQSIKIGDHVLLVGLVDNAEKADTAPLIYGERTYGTHSSLAAER
jgi:flavin reductase (DIM6/NTAB) family NADH-FMN oxidoreductase RutF